jgi:hypothetical protein
MCRKRGETWTLHVPGSPTKDAYLRNIPGSGSDVTFSAFPVPSKELTAVPSEGVGLVTTGKRFLLIPAHGLPVSVAGAVPRTRLTGPDGVQWEVVNVDGYNGKLATRRAYSQEQFFEMEIGRVGVQ